MSRAPREYRAAPTRVASLVPPALVAASGHGDGQGALRSMVESIIGATHDKAAALGERAHAAAELATGQKLAAVAASAAALAGGGAAVEHATSGRDDHGRQKSAAVKPLTEEPPAQEVAEAPLPSLHPRLPQPLHLSPSHLRPTRQTSLFPAPLLRPQRPPRPPRRAPSPRAMRHPARVAAAASSGRSGHCPSGIGCPR